MGEQAEKEKPEQREAGQKTAEPNTADLADAKAPEPQQVSPTVQGETEARAESGNETGLSAPAATAGSQPSATSTRQPFDVEFRSMRVDDIATICEIEKEAFPTPWSAGAFHNELTNNHFAHYMVMECGGEIAGYCGMWLIMDEAHITNIAVRKPYRGLKLGERLLTEIQKTASFLGAIRMTLEVRVSNRVAQNLYEKKGFHGVGLRKGYYSDNNEDALIMWADLPKYNGA